MMQRGSITRKLAAAGLFALLVARLDALDCAEALNRGRELAAARQSAAAIAALQPVLTAAEATPEQQRSALNLLLDLNARERRWREAAGLCEQFLTQLPEADRPAFQLRAAEYYLQDQALAEALQTLTPLLERPDLAPYPAARLLQSEILRRRKDYAGCRTILQELRVAPNLPTALQIRATIAYIRLYRLDPEVRERQLGAALQSIAENPEATPRQIGDAYLAAAETLRPFGRRTDAAECLRRALALDQEPPFRRTLLEALASVYEESGQSAAAIRTRRELAAALEQAEAAPDLSADAWHQLRRQTLRNLAAIPGHDRNRFLELAEAAVSRDDATDSRKLAVLELLAQSALKEKEPERVLPAARLAAELKEVGSFSKFNFLAGLRTQAVRGGYRELEAPLYELLEKVVAQAPEADRPGLLLRLSDQNVNRGSAQEQLEAARSAADQLPEREQQELEFKIALAAGQQKQYEKAYAALKNLIERDGVSENLKNQARLARLTLLSGDPPVTRPEVEAMLKEFLSQPDQPARRYGEGLEAVASWMFRRREYQRSLELTQLQLRFPATAAERGHTYARIALAYQYLKRPQEEPAPRRRAFEYYSRALQSTNHGRGTRDFLTLCLLRQVGDRKTFTESERRFHANRMLQDRDLGFEPRDYAYHLLLNSFRADRDCRNFVRFSRRRAQQKEFTPEQRFQTMLEAVKFCVREQAKAQGRALIRELLADPALKAEQQQALQQERRKLE